MATEIITNDRTTDYARCVASGLVVANAHVTASCKRHLKDLKRKDIYFDLAAANRAIRFFENILRLNGGQFENLPFKLHTSQCFIVGSLFGWKKTRDNFRRFRRAYIEISKGNGKSPLAAGLGIYALVADGEARAEIYAAATKLNQAMVLFRDAKAMVQLSPELSTICTISGGEHTPNIAFIDTGSFFRPISNDKGQSGPRPHVAICDEVHEHPDRDTMEMLERGFKFRNQPLLVMITNSGFNRNSICFEEHDHAVKVAHGEIDDDTTFSFVCGIDKGDNPLEDESCWIKANPLLDITITTEYLRGIVKMAKAMPGKRNSILRLHFCVWTEVSSVWMGREAWEACEVVDLKPDFTLPCFGALDLSAKQDLTSAAWVWKRPDGSLDALVEFWAPEDNMKDREDRDRVPYIDWHREGYLNTTPGASVNMKHLVPHIAAMNGKTDLKVLGYDRWRMDILKNELNDAGIIIETGDFGQGFKDMGPAVEAIEEAILNGRLRVCFNPVLRWNISNAVIEMNPAGDRKFAKNKSNGRIDGLVALTMAIRLAQKEGTVNIDEFINNPLRFN